MTKYKLEEFKEWLEADESRYSQVSTLSNWQNNLNIIKNAGIFDDFVEGRDCPGHQFATNPSWQPYVEVAKRWKAIVDQHQQERERERERESRGRNHV